MAYDAARQRVVMFGGSNATSSLDDTWEWDGSAWTSKSTVGNGMERRGHAMTYDPVAGRVVMFVGDNLAVRVFGTASLIGENTCVLTALILIPALLGILSKKPVTAATNRRYSPPR